MRRSLVLLGRSLKSPQANLIQIHNGTFFREHPSTDSQDQPHSTNPPLFPKLTFELPATLQEGTLAALRTDQHWAVIGTADGTTFLEVLGGSHICIPPTARSFPYLSSDEIERKDHRLRIPSRAIQYVGFNAGQGQRGGGGGVRGAYLSARYESRREETDWSVLQYLKGETELNPTADATERQVDEGLLARVIADLRLHKLTHMPVSSLSNGQTRRARIAKALLGKPEILLLDEPFMGLDPPTLVTLSPILRDLAYRSSPLLLLGLRPQDPVPDWITHLVVLGQHHTVSLLGEKSRVLFRLCRWAEAADRQSPTGASTTAPGLDVMMAREMSQRYGPPPAGVGDVLTEKGIFKSRIFQFVQDSHFPEYLQPDSTINPDTLSSEDARRWKAALSRQNNTNTNTPLDDLLTLTSTLPANFPPSDAATTGQTRRPTNQVAGDDAVDERLGAPLIDLRSVVVKYGSKTVLGHPPPQQGFSAPGLNLTIRQGTRLALLGPNGSGKTTLLSLLTSDHPQSYSLPIEFFGRSRLPNPGQPGLSLWQIQSRIGHSSPEIHAFFPKTHSIRRVLESAWADTYSSKPVLTPETRQMVDRTLRWWEPELREDMPAASSSNGESTSSSDLAWAEDRTTYPFGRLPFAVQRLLLLLRAIIKNPDIVILDEAFSGLSAEVRDKAISWLEHGETSAGADASQPATPSATPASGRFRGLLPSQALVVVSHVKEEIPRVVNEWVRLPGEEEVSEHGRGVEVGRTAPGGLSTGDGWMKVWGF